MPLSKTIEELLASYCKFTLISIIASASYVLYLAALAIYRLYLSPIAKFPGPKLAALTQWQETYYEIVKKGGGQFTFQIRKWHEQYGPIIRINPFEIHIDDPEYYETIYSTSQHYDKLRSLQYRLNLPHAIFSTPEHDIHHRRRAALSPFFSKRKVSDYAPTIQSNVDRICNRIENEYAGKGQVLVLNELWGCLATDVVVDHLFARSYDFIGSPDFRSPFTTSIRNLTYSVHWGTQFPLIRLMSKLPDSITGLLMPSMKSVLQFHQEIRKQILDVLQGKNMADKDTSRATVFHEILKSDLPPSELSVDRLQNEAAGIVGAGIETTKGALSGACFHILDNPPILARLRQELIEAIPDPQNPPSLDSLMQLPYLSACIEEAIRLSYGTVQRSQRVSHHAPFIYGPWTIPPGVPVSMDTSSLHHNERTFPDSYAYKPERWLGNPKGPDGKKFLSRYMTAFGRGTRICIGMHLAYAQIYIGLAALFRRFGLELFETDRTAVDFYQDMLAPVPKPGTLGVRVLVK